LFHPAILIAPCNITFSQVYPFNIFSRKEMLIIDIYQYFNSLGKGKLIGRVTIPLSFIHRNDKVAAIEGWVPIEYAGNFKTSKFIRGKEFRDAIAVDEYTGSNLLKSRLRRVTEQKPRKVTKKELATKNPYGLIRLRVEFVRTRLNKKL